MMIIFPAIDLKDGHCVRLERGKLASETRFSDSPASQACQFASEGAQWLHVVDLDGAFEGIPKNAPYVSEIVSNVGIPVQLGGGIREMATIEHWLDVGIARIVLGTVAIEAPEIAKEAAKAFPGKVAVGIDARNGLVATRGWSVDTKKLASELAMELEGFGIAALIYTDIDKDGMLGGPNLNETAKLAGSVSIPVIASGGISTIKDIHELDKNIPDLHGAIIGRALYDGGMNLADAISAAGHNEPACRREVEAPKGPDREAGKRRC